MKVEMNGIPLDKDEEGGAGRSITRMDVTDERNVEAYDAPGTQGSTYSDLGRSAVKISFDGTATGQDARSVLEGIWACFKTGDPVEFRSDVSGAADITKVLIDSFTVKSVAGDRDRYDYAIELWEYREPPEEPEMAGASGASSGEAEEGAETEQEAAAKEKAKKWAGKEAVASEEAKNTLTGSVLDASGKPVKGVKVRIVGESEELSAKTDEQGVYSVSDLKPGVYVITVDAEGFEDEEEEVYVG